VAGLADGRLVDSESGDIRWRELPWGMLQTPTRQPVTVQVAAAPHAVLEHLRSVLDDGWAVRLCLRVPSTTVVGSVDGTRVVLRSSRSRHRGFGARRMLVLDVVPSGAGTVLHGQVQVPAFYEQWLLLWRALNVFFALTMLVALGYTLVADRAQLPKLLIFICGWTALAAAQGLSIVWSFRTDDRETQRLLGWLDRQRRTLERTR
jgi:hypothetical protein